LGVVERLRFFCGILPFFIYCSDLKDLTVVWEVCVWYTVGMLYVFCGDRFGARELSKEFVAACQKKREGAEYIYLSPADEHHSLEELLLGQGLFERKYIVFCDEMIADSSGRHLIDNLSRYVASPHMFVVFEPSLDVRGEKKFSAVGAVINRCQERKVVSEDTRSVFAFVDVFLRGDRGKSFTALHSLLLRGGLSSTVLNMLLWQLRVLVLVSQSDSASVAGLKPFVYTKAKKALVTIDDPFALFVRAEEVVRVGRLRGSTDAEIAEYLVLSL